MNLFQWNSGIALIAILFMSATNLLWKLLDAALNFYSIIISSHQPLKYEKMLYEAELNIN